MHRRRDPGATPQRILQVERPVVLLEKIAKGLVSEFLEILHLVTAEQIDLLPGFIVKLYAFARHQLAFLCRE